MSKLETVADAVLEWDNCPICISRPQLKGNLRTIFQKYILPELGFKPDLIKHDYLSCLAIIKLPDFLANTTNILDWFADKNKYPVQKTTLNYYASVLKKFFKFLYFITADRSNFQSVNSAVSQYLSGQSLRNKIYSPTSPTNKPFSGEAESKPIITLSERDLPSRLEADIKQIRTYLSSNESTIKSTTFNIYLKHLLYFLGWLSSSQQVDFRELNLKLVTNIVDLKNFINWGIVERENSFGWAINIITACIFVAKYYLAIDQGDERVKAALQDYLQKIRQKYLAQQEESSGETELSFEQLVEIINYLRDSCTPYHSNGVPRSQLAQIKSWQRYLIVSLLAYCPLRLNEVRQLTISNNILNQGGRFYLDLSSFIKDKDCNGWTKMPLLIPDFLRTDLARWLNDFRPQISSEHDLVFVKLGSPRYPFTKGKPLAIKDLSEMITNCLNKATSQLYGEKIAIMPHQLGTFRYNYLSVLGVNQNSHSRRKSTLDDAIEQCKSSGNTAAQLKQKILPEIVQLEQRFDPRDKLGGIGAALKQLDYT